ncbi:MAG: acetylserotonin O-methyltransferase [Archaeoglobaceae archaeon]|nr:acetylserotonin O-methyltransferase [Archaeoglobaceae archaeon]MCX8152535.1 acetylserotonin O-methyltransferase [Archaeoglobaceae archaeon]MDW8014044.1 methyltransferase [Archaeoglobaceae archaeon]
MFERVEGAEDFLNFINSALDGARRIYALKAAIDLNIFEILKKPSTLDELVEKLNCDRKLLKVFLDALCSLKLLEKQEDLYKCSNLSLNFLTSLSPYSQIETLKNQINSLESWRNLAEIFKRGPVVFKPGEFFRKRIKVLAKSCLLGELQEVLEIVSSLQEFRDARKLLDLGGGHGLYAIAFTTLNKKIEAYVFDLPEVVEEVRFESERVKFIAGDFFKDDIGSGYDIVFSSFNPAGKNAKMIEKIYKSLNCNGLYINRQVFADEPSLLDVEWNLWKFEGIEKGERVYSFSEDLSFEDYLKELEKFFKVEKVVKLKRSTMIISRKVTSSPSSL